MKISYRNKEGIKVIETGKFDLGINHTNRALNDLMNRFNQQKQIYKPIKVLSNTLFDVITTTSEKMTKDEIWNNVGNNLHGSILFYEYTICYLISSNNMAKHDFEVFIFYKSKLLAYGWQNTEIDKRVITVNNEFKDYAIHSFNLSEKNWMEEFFNSYYTLFIAILNFLKYADVQDKILKANGKEVINKEKYLNETNSDISFISSNYITNLYVEGAFKVRGHWRLQPKKVDGKLSKELIWINEFEKKGYTRKAGISNLNS